MDNPLVSVILCCYNQQDYVEQAIRSVLCQRCDFDFELIVGEDASSDHTADVCRRIQSDFPDKMVLMCNEKNKGLIYNYFDCIRQSRGQLIADCAGDDFWVGDNRLQHLVDAWHEHPEAGIVYGNYADYDTESDSYTRHNTDVAESVCRVCDYGPKAVARFLSRQLHPDIVISTAVYPKRLLYNYLDTHPEMFFNPSYPAEDISVTAALLMQGPAFYLNEVNMAYRVTDGSISHSADERKAFVFDLKTFVQTIDWAVFLNVEHGDMKSWLKRYCAWYMHRAFRLGSKDGAIAIRKACRRMDCKLPWKTALKYSFIQVFGK